MIVGIIVGIVAVAVIAGFVFVNQPSFGRAPQGLSLIHISSVVFVFSSVGGNHHLRPLEV